MGIPNNDKNSGVINISKDTVNTSQSESAENLLATDLSRDLLSQNFLKETFNMKFNSQVKNEESDGKFQESFN